MKVEFKKTGDGVNPLKEALFLVGIEQIGTEVFFEMLAEAEEHDNLELFKEHLERIVEPSVFDFHDESSIALINAIPEIDETQILKVGALLLEENMEYAFMKGFFRGIFQCYRLKDGECDECKGCCNM